MKAPALGHLGPKISALLDGQLSPADEERAWDHVHGCHLCRDEVEREGWVKTRLASMSWSSPGGAPDSLKGSLLVSGWAGTPVPDEVLALAGHPVHSGPRRGALGLAALGGGAVGAALMGVVALGVSPANAPGVIDRPAGSVTGGSQQAPLSSVVDRVYGPVTKQALEREDTAPVVRALRRTLTP